MDRAYLHYERLYRIAQCGSFFVTRPAAAFSFAASTLKRSTNQPVCVRTRPLPWSASILPRPTPKDSGVSLTSTPTVPERFVFITNQFALPAIIITQIYRLRWQIELFFKWIKQHLRIQELFGTSENAVKTQIWIAVSVYVLIAIIRKRLRLEISLHKILQILSFTY